MPWVGIWKLQQNGGDEVVVGVCSMDEGQPLQMTGLRTMT